MSISEKILVKAGKPAGEARSLALLVHGRGADAGDILSLASLLSLSDFALWAPRADGHAWYPETFLAPLPANEPFLSAALDRLEEVVREAEEHGLGREKIFFIGFSQGACLSLEYLARSGCRWGGCVAFSGGLIGEQVQMEQYRVGLSETPVFIGSSDPDPHIPVQRVLDSADLLEKLGANVKAKIYQGLGHRVSGEEIDEAERHVFKRV